LEAGVGLGTVHIIPQAPQEKKSFCALSMLAWRIQKSSDDYRSAGRWSAAERRD